MLHYFHQNWQAQNENKMSQHFKYTVDRLVEKSVDYLKQNDTAQASEKAMQACRLTLMQYVRHLENNYFADGKKKIIPENHTGSPWSYSKFCQLCTFLTRKIRGKNSESEEKLAMEFDNGWKNATFLHTNGWTQNNVTVQDAEEALPRVFRFIDILQDLPVEQEWADYLYEQFHPEPTAEEEKKQNELVKQILKEAKNGEAHALLTQGISNPKKAYQLDKKCKEVNGGKGFAQILTPTKLEKYVQNGKNKK